MTYVNGSSAERHEAPNGASESALDRNAALRQRSDAPLGTLIYRAGLLPAEEIEKVLAESVRTKRRLGQMLVERGMIKEDDLARLLAEQKGLTHVRLRDTEINLRAIQVLGADVAWRYHAVPLGFEDDAVVIAIADPADDEVRTAITEELHGRAVKFAVATRSDVLDALGRAYPLNADGGGAHAPLPAATVTSFPVAHAVEETPAPSDEIDRDRVLQPAAAPVPAAEDAQGSLPQHPAGLVVAPVPAAAPAGELAPPAEHLDPLVAPVQDPPAARAQDPAAAPGPAPAPAPAPAPETIRVAVGPSVVEDPAAAPAPAPAPARAPAPAPAAIRVAVGPAVVEESGARANPGVDPVALGGEAPRDGVVAATTRDSADERPTPSEPVAAVTSTRVAVVVGLADGGVVRAGEFEDAETAQDEARKIMREVATSGPADWPLVGGRFLRPDLIVSVEVGPAPADA